MIDLRSDTLTLPTAEMKKAMYYADLGDAGRLDSKGRGEDPTINRLENIAANIIGKEDAMFVPSGTMGNLVALMTYCKTGQYVGVGKNLHVYRTEKGAFLYRPGELIPKFFKTDRYGIPKLESVKALVEGKHVDLICLENTHNFAGGTCLSKEEIDNICLIAKKNNVPVHLDGARIFNASIYLNTPVDKLIESVDTIMFCLSKGLGAPVGSMLCGRHDFILKARKTRKILGGTMRQAGVIAASGIIAIQKGREKLREDHGNARLLADRIVNNKRINLDLKTVQTNIVKVDVSPSGYNSKSCAQGLKRRGLKCSPVSEKDLRFVIYRGIRRRDIIQASNIINEYFELL